jgi:hypothetical protein
MLLSVVALGHQPPYQADRPRCARDIRGRIGLALDCRSGPGPKIILEGNQPACLVGSGPIHQAIFAGLRVPFL